MSKINVEQLKKDIKEEIIKSEILMSLEDDDGVSLSDIFKGLKKRWKMIAAITLIVAVASVYYSLSLPNFYKSSGSVYIEKTKTISLTGSSEVINNAELIYTSLNCESTTNYIINRFGVATNPAFIGNVGNSQKAILYDELLQKVNKAINIKLEKNSNIITITAETMNSDTSAKIVNAYIEKISELISEPQKEHFIFVKKQLDKSKEELFSCEEKYKKFIEDNNITSFESASNTPLLALEMAKFNREIQSKEKIFNMLNDQYEIAKITNSNESSKYKIIEKPRATMLKSKPSRSVIVILFSVAGFIISICLALALEFSSKKE